MFNMALILYLMVYSSGLIGRSWAMLFAAAGYRVVMTDIESSMIDQALANIKLQLHDLKSTGLLRGSLNVDEQYALISGTTDFEECVKGCVYIQVRYGLAEVVCWLCLTSHRQRGHLETAPPFTVPCEGREAR